MFFLVLCLILWAFIAFHSSFDQFGWLMLVALGWFLGFLDGRRYMLKDQDKTGCVPTDYDNDGGNDASLFNT